MHLSSCLWGGGLVLVVIAGILPTRGLSAEAPNPSPYVLSEHRPCAPGELLVKWANGPGTSAAPDGNSRVGATVFRTFDEIGWQQVVLPVGMSVTDGIERYRGLGSVLLSWQWKSIG